MASFSAYPPIRHHSSRPIDSSQAQRFLAEFLEQAATDHSLHPNALLTDHGPVNPTSTSTGLVLHNLERIEAGLRGEHLAADLSFKIFGGEGLPTLTDTKARNHTDDEAGIEETGPDLEMDWQDKEEYEREQTVDQGEVGTRNNVLEEQNHDKLSSVGVGVMPAVGRPGDASKEDTAARKRKKKEKRLQMKRTKEDQRYGSAKT
ncbi:MAG: hypothetical protein Q9220_002359 [cf. Caloplaca sp. 1 TL-2023]